MTKKQTVEMMDDAYHALRYDEKHTIHGSRRFCMAAAYAIAERAIRADDRATFNKLLREAFDAGMRQGDDEATSYGWGARPYQSKEDAFTSFLEGLEIDRQRAILAQESTP